MVRKDGVGGGAGVSGVEEEGEESWWYERIATAATRRVERREREVTSGRACLVRKGTVGWDRPASTSDAAAACSGSVSDMATRSILLNNSAGLAQHTRTGDEVGYGGGSGARTVCGVGGSGGVQGD